MEVENKLPTNFLKRTIEFLGEPIASDLFESLAQSAPTAIRYNPLKNSEPENLEKVSWNSHGHYLPVRPSFVEDPNFFQGKYYVQEASSMVIGGIINQLDRLNPIHTVLDLCAAPGGKSTDIIGALPAAELVVSNELVNKRVQGLQENLIKWGNRNSLLTHTNPENFSHLKESFDLVVVDAPCSGEGMFRKDRNARSLWSPNLVQNCQETQKKILLEVWNSLKTGGFMIYSTCTFNREENESVMEFLASKLGINPISQDWLTELGPQEFQWKSGAVVGTTYRFLPGKIKGEGFTVSVIQKSDPEKVHSSKRRNQKAQRPWNVKPFNEKTALLSDQRKGLWHWIDKVYDISEPLLEFADQYANLLNLQYLGTEIGRASHKGLIPSHSLSMRSGFSFENSIELSKEESLKFLRREPVQSNSNAKGWTLLTHGNSGLGWGKIQNGTIKSHFPSEYKIRKPEN